MATSHELGQNFSRAFDVTYTSDTGSVEHCWTTSWGSSTRMVGGLIMAHGDDNGLRIPPRLAPVQVVVMVVRADEGVLQAARAIASDLTGAGMRVRLDERFDTGFGRRATDWELKGVPVRIEVGPRDLAQGQVTLVRRDTAEKVTVAVERAQTDTTDLLATVQQAMFDEATARRESRMADVATVAEAQEAAATGFARLPWSAVGDQGEDVLASSAITVRCVARPDGSLPDSLDEPDLIAVVARSY